MNGNSGVCPKVSPNVFHKQKGSLHLLLHPHKPKWLVINNLGWEIAKFCDGKHDVKDITASIAVKYGTEPAKVSQDIKAFLTHLSQAHFLSNGNYKKKLKTSLKRLHLNIIEVCNLKCTHCGVIDGNTNDERLAKEKAFEIIDELSEDESASLAISGGEPLLHKDCLEILEYASNRVKTSLSTNATLIDESTAQILSSLDISLQISLDGSNANFNDKVRGDGAFVNTIRGIRLLQNHGAGDRISIFSTVMRHNIDSVPDVINLAEWLGIPSVSFLPVQRIGTARSSWNELCPTPQEYTRLYTYLYKEFHSTSINISGGFQGFLLDIPDSCRWCHLGDTLAIDSKGDIYPCSLMIHPEFHIGNIHNTSLKEAVESNSLRKIINTCESRENRIEKCKDCIWKNFCQASCPGSVFFQKGTLHDTDDLCELRQKLYPEMIFDMAEKKTNGTALRHSMECDL